MRNRNLPMVAIAIVALTLSTGAAWAQQAQQQAQHVFTPMVSPAAKVAQRIGLTDVAVAYHRPAVNDRDVWANVVFSTGPIWRTGANENTLISFSTDVTVQGQALAAGTYGLHSIPGEDSWTLIFSNDSHAWGSFSYNQEHDALRVTATPQKAPFQERFEISFQNLQADRADLVLHWAEVAVPVTVAIDLPKTVIASFEQQLTGLSQFFWQGPNQAANYLLNNDLDLDQALTWAEQSIATQVDFNNLATKAQILAKKGDTAAAEEVMAQALPMGNAGQLHNYARTLLGLGQKEEALEVFKTNVEQNGDAWFVELGLARGYSALGDFENATKNMRIAHGKAPEAQKAYVQGLIDQLESKTDIN